MEKAEKWGLAGIITGIIIPLLGMIFSIVGIVTAEDNEERVLPIVGVFVAVLSWMVWVVI